LSSDSLATRRVRTSAFRRAPHRLELRNLAEGSSAGLSGDWPRPRVAERHEHMFSGTSRSLRTLTSRTATGFQPTNRRPHVQPRCPSANEGHPSGSIWSSNASARIDPVCQCSSTRPVDSTSGIRYQALRRAAPAPADLAAAVSVGNPCEDDLVPADPDVTG